MKKKRLNLEASDRLPRPLLKDRITRTLTGDCLKDFWLTPQFLLTASRRLFATTKRVFVCPLFLQGVSGARRLGRMGGQASFSRASVQPTAARLEDLECLSGVSVHCRLRTCARGEGDSRTIEVRDSIDTRVSLTFPPVHARRNVERVAHGVLRMRSAAGASAVIFARAYWWEGSNA